jgi:exonuclease SbcC
MKILELSLRNYRVFEEVDLELPARVIGIFGPNGAGKSTLVESIGFACFGMSRTNRDQIRTGGILTDGAVRVVFEHGGSQYEVRRTIRGRNHQTDAELFVGDRQLAAGVKEVDAEIQRLLRMDVHVFRASVFAEQKQLDAFSDVTKAKRKEMVLRLLGIRPVDQARTAARKEARDTRTAAERLVGSLPETAELETALATARATADEAGARVAEAAATLAEAEARAKDAERAFLASDEVRQQVERLDVERRGLDREVESLEERTSRMGDRIASLETAVETLPAMESELADVAEAPARLREAERAVEVATEAAGVEAELVGLPAVDAATALATMESARERVLAAERANTKAEADRERAASALASARVALERASEADPSQPCPTCGRPLGEDFEGYLTHCRGAVAEAKRAASAAAKASKETGSALAAAREREAEATRAGEEVRHAGEIRARLSSRAAELMHRLVALTVPFEGRVPDLEPLRARAVRAAELAERISGLRGETKHLEALRADLEKDAAALETARARLTELDREEAGLAFEPEEHQRLAKERGEAVRLLDTARVDERRAAHDAATAERDAAALEARIREVEEIRARVGGLQDDARYLDRVATLLEGFRTHLYGRIIPELSSEAQALFAELTSRAYDDLRIDPETLAIEIADGERYYPIERFSGSESDLANLALRVAISTHLSRMSGADVGMLVLDEVLASLDVERKDLFVQAMGRLASRFHQLFVITHAEQVKDQFPASIEVQPSGRRRSTAVLR